MSGKSLESGKTMPEGMREGVPLGPMTTLGVGGPARWFAEPGDEARFLSVARWAGERGHALFLLGGGSNLLIADEGFDGVVVRLGGDFTRIRREGDWLVAGAGASLPKLALAALNLGYVEFLPLAGIPGTVGGAVRGNAGADGGAVSDLLAWAEVWRGEDGVRRRDAAEFAYGYRHSALMDEPGAVVLRAAFLLGGERVEPAEALARRKEKLAARRARQPRNPRTCGSVFRNPPQGPPAGFLLERAGLKGVSVGGARVSQRHANWIVNEGGATAADVKALIALAHAQVLETFGVALEREVFYFPEDLAPR